MKANILTLCLLIWFNGNLWAQPKKDITISSSQGGGAYIQFNNQNDLDNGGVSIGNIQIQFAIPGGNNEKNWKLTVQVTSPITVNNTTLDPQYVLVKHNPSLSSEPTFANAIQAPQVFIPMSYNEVTLIASSATPLKAPPYYSVNIRYDLKIQGGPQLVELQNGSYPCQLTFRLYNSSGVLMSSSSTTYGFGKYFNGSGGGGGGSTPITSLTLVNGAQSTSLDFNGPADYVTGASLTISNGLRAQSTEPYQIKVKSSAANFSSSQTSIIPISAIKLQSTNGAPAPSAVTHNTISLDNIGKTLMTKDGWTDPNPVYYNLKYFTTPNDTNFSNARSGNYTTTLTYTMEPK